MHRQHSCGSVSNSSLVLPGSTCAHRLAHTAGQLWVGCSDTVLDLVSDLKPFKVAQLRASMSEHSSFDA